MNRKLGIDLSVVSQTEPDSVFSSIEDVLEDARNGKMIIIVDAEDRENEGDLIISSQMATPDAINFMAKHGRGLICLALTPQRVQQLGLEPMTQQNRARMKTAFTVSIEAREGISTGISAHDRARTIAVAVDQTRGAEDIVSPGHIFPLIAREGGVLVRAGHTEAAVDIARLAGLYPSGVVCEIMNDDGTMARLDDLIPFAQNHGLKIGTIADLIAYRRKHDSIVSMTQETTIESVFGGEFKLKIYSNTVEPAEHVALIKGDIDNGEPVPVRMHAASALTDILGIGTKGHKRSLVQKSMEMIGKEGRGVVVLIRDVRSDAVSSKLGLVEGEAPAKERRLIEIGIGAQILLDLGVREMILITNSPLPRVVGLDAYGLTIKEVRTIES
ncbi:MAG: 3,4-dihydroxy-2-butanone-4-phosphate synthase [Methyloligellaceae bacterium]